jgi:type III restriction enzyme
MAMLIAWHTVNAVRSPNSHLFSRGFLIVTPGITIRDRLRVLLPADSESYYTTRQLVPADMLPEMGKAKIIITNYHALGRRRRLDTNKVGEAILSGWRKEELITEETEGEMLQRACEELLSMKNVVVMNDEAHHCYREKVGDSEEDKLTAEDRQEAKDNNEAARLWISGIEALKLKVGVRAIYDLSATPFFLRGSGYEEGTLFPWVVSDFALVDAIECGIVKLPRVPVSDNAVNAEMPVFRNIWEHIKSGPIGLPKKGAAKSGELDPHQTPPVLQTALHALYSHYEEEHQEWQRAGIKVPPVFIVVCNNTATSKLVYEWISGWQREIEGELQTIHYGHLKLFSNFDEFGNRRARMNTLLIDSRQIEAGDALSSEAFPERHVSPARPAPARPSSRSIAPCTTFGNRPTRVSCLRPSPIRWRMLCNRSSVSWLDQRPTFSTVSPWRRSSGSLRNCINWPLATRRILPPVTSFAAWSRRRARPPVLTASHLSSCCRNGLMWPMLGNR